MKQRLSRVGLFLLCLVCIVTLSAPHTVRTLLYRQLYPLVAVDARLLEAPPDDLRSIGYTQDEPMDMADFRAVAESAVASAKSDGERLRRLGDAIYAMRRPGSPWIVGGREQGPLVLMRKMQNGDRGLCGHMVLVLAALWRSLDRDFRGIRFTTSDASAWSAAHYGIEVYSRQSRRWMYYDVGLNGYAVGAAGEPLSLSDLNRELAAGSDIAIVADPFRQDWDTARFLGFLRQNRFQVISLDNRLRTLDADRRFGRLHFAYALFSRLPHPIDRVVDAVTGDSGPRMVARDPVPAPSAQARLHLSAMIPRG